jgi:membrane associated rhomboid family serine protease
MDVCYRHPDRETGVACSNCERPICPDCMTSTPVGMRCPECAKQRTKVKTMSTVETPTLTYVLMGISIVVALGALMAGDREWGGTLLDDDFAVARSTVADGEVWRLVTSGFVHYGPFHLGLNMLGLYILGSLLEPAFGRVRFGVVYFVSLLAGSFGALLLQPVGDTVGASGAIFGLMGAAVVLFRNRGIPLMESGLGFWLGLNLLMSLRPGISLGGHLGGFIGGLIAAYVLVELQDRLRLSRPVALALAGAVGVVSVGGALAVAAS